MDTSLAALAELIRSHLDEIFDAWEPSARKLPGAAELSHLVLVDHLPAILERIARSVEAGGPAMTSHDGAAGSFALSEHVLQRAEIGAGLGQVIAELMLLRDAVERVWPASAQPDARQALSALREAFDQTILESAEHFSELRMSLLEAVDLVVKGAAGHGLDEILENVLQALIHSLDGVDTAAILLREGDTLRMRAAVGLEKEEIQRFSLPADEGFAGLVAAEGRPHLVRSAATDPLVKNPVLRRAGIKALYGVPMCPEHESSPIIGVAHIGSKSASDFSEQTKALFRVLVARAAGVLRQVMLREQLELERARYAAVVESSPAVIFSKDKEGRYLTISRRALEPHGLTPEAVIGHTDLEVFPEEVARALRSADQEVLERRITVEREETLPASGGSRTYLSVKFPILDSRQELIGVAGVSTDITARLRWESGHRLLAEAGAVLASSLDHERTLAEVGRLAVPALADCCILDVIDEDGKVRRVQVLHTNRGGGRLAEELLRVPLDRSRPHLVGAVLQSHEPVLMAEVPAGYLETIAQSERHLGLLRELRPISMMQVPLQARGRLLGAWVFLLAETDRRYDAWDLEVATELGRRASLAVDNARLYGAAKRAVKARDDVLAVIAHDLRDPLNAILMSAETMRARLAPGAHRERRAVGTMTRAAEQMSRLIAELLDQQTIEAGKLSIEREWCPAAELVREVAEMNGPRVEAASLGLDVALPADLPLVSVDRDRAHQVFYNLIGNAIKFSPAGGRLTLGASAGEGGVTFFVWNSGAGIAADDLPHIFDRYWQARRADRRGVGLGLAICKGIVEAHGGTIWVESEPGQGATLSFTIPETRPSDAPGPGTGG